jgi:hypothetical protein
MKYLTAQQRRPRFLLALGTGLVLAAALGARPAAAAPYCDVPLKVKLTPDVPSPSDVGFLNSLLGNHPQYRLVYRGHDTDDSDDIHVMLAGPGPDYLCWAVIETMRRDGRIVFVQRDYSPG